MDFLRRCWELWPQLSWPWWLAALTLGAALALVTRIPRKRGRMSSPQAAALVALGTYLFLVLAYTVLSRTPGETYTYQLDPFWTLEPIRGGSTTFLVEGFYNLLMLTPLGLLLPVILTRPGARHIGLKTVGLGFFCSAAIEILQLVTKRGLCEVNDVINNTLGAAIGWGVFCVIRRIYMKRHPHSTFS